MNAFKVQLFRVKRVLFRLKKEKPLKGVFTAVALADSEPHK